MSRETTRLLETIRDTASLINAGSDLDAVLERIAYAVCQHTDWSKSGIMAADRESGYSELVARHDPDAGTNSSLPDRWALGMSPALRVIDRRAPIVIQDAQRQDDFPDYRDDSIARGYHTAVVIPLSIADSRGREMVLSVQSSYVVEVGDVELTFLTTLAQLASIAVGNAKILDTEKQTSRRLEHTLDVNTRLLERVLSGCSLDVLLDMLSTMLSAPIVLVDTFHELCYGARSPFPDKVSNNEWTHALSNGARDTLVDVIETSSSTDFRSTICVPISLDNLEVFADAYVEPLSVDGEIVGGIIIFPHSDLLDDLSILIAQEAKFAVSALLMRTHALRHRDASIITDFFDRLFGDDWVDEKRIAARGTRIGIDVQTRSILLGIKAPATLAPHLPSQSDQRLSRIERVALRYCSKAVVIPQSECLLLYMPTTAQSNRDMENDIETNLLPALQKAIGVTPIAAIGPLCDGPSDLRAACAQCIRMTQIAETFDRTGAIRQDEFGPLALLLSSVDITNLTMFIKHTIGAIESHDAANGTSLLPSLRAFLDNECRHQRTANQLGIHVSTLRYRLDRISSLFSISLDNPDTRFSFSLAFRLRDIASNPDLAR